MKVILKNELLILVPETPAETAQLVEWKEGRETAVLGLQAKTGSGIREHSRTNLKKNRIRPPRAHLGVPGAVTLCGARPEKAMIRSASSRAW